MVLVVLHMPILLSLNAQIDRFRLVIVDQGGRHGGGNSKLKNFGNNYRNSLITGFLRKVLSNSPTLHPKLGVLPDIPIRTDKHPSMLGK